MLRKTIDDSIIQIGSEANLPVDQSVGRYKINENNEQRVQASACNGSAHDLQSFMISLIQQKASTDDQLRVIILS